MVMQNIRNVKGVSITINFSMMNLAFWNIRGLNSPIKPKEVKNFITTNKICFVCILETKVKERNISNISRNTFGN